MLHTHSHNTRALVMLLIEYYYYLSRYFNTKASLLLLMNMDALPSLIMCHRYRRVHGARPPARMFDIFFYVLPHISRQAATEYLGQQLLSLHFPIQHIIVLYRHMHFITPSFIDFIHAISISKRSHLILPVLSPRAARHYR